jgi:hypothetical protein
MICDHEELFSNLILLSHNYEWGNKCGEAEMDERASLHLTDLTGIQ